MLIDVFIATSVQVFRGSRGLASFADGGDSANSLYPVAYHQRHADMGPTLPEPPPTPPSITCLEGRELHALSEQTGTLIQESFGDDPTTEDIRYLSSAVYSWTCPRRQYCMRPYAITRCLRLLR